MKSLDSLTGRLGLLLDAATVLGVGLHPLTPEQIADLRDGEWP